MLRRRLPLTALALVCALPALAQTGANLFARENLVAWCIVPFDAKKRGPEARAEMLARMGVTKLAYDWRAEHIATFDEEIQTMRRWNIGIAAWWFPGALNDEAKAILAALERNDLKTDLWITMHGGEIVCTSEEQVQRVADHAAAIKPIAEAAAAQGCTVSLYNHGAWFGEPRNQIAIIEALKAQGVANVRIVYNQHHGHHHVDGFAELLADMLPYLSFLNLNGMEPAGDQTGRKIWPIGSGALDKDLLRIIRDSGYAGPIGILNHTDLDAAAVLLDNLDGLEWIVPQLDGAAPSGLRPPLRTAQPQTEARAVPSVSDAFGFAMEGGFVTEGNPAYAAPPITVECRAVLRSSSGYNILAANHTKVSGAHWEMFTEAGSGALSVYTPGLTPDHLRTDRVLTDGRWRHIAMHLDTDRIALYVDGEKVGEQSVARNTMAVAPGGFAIGRLVEGGFYCDGAIDDVRIRTGLRPIVVSDAPLTKDADTIAIFAFDDLPTLDDGLQPIAYLIENPERRAALPEYQTIPAADPASLSPTLPAPETYFTNWTRSHGDPHNTRFAAADQITRDNVAQLKQAWIYRSGDGPENVQCNPIVVGDLLIAPTSGRHIAAIDAATGVERWRMKPEGRPAHRGLVYWPGDGVYAPRILMPAGDFVYALDPETGAPIASFGDDGRIAPGPSVVAPAVCGHVLIVPGFLRDVWGFDVRTGERLWTFETAANGESFEGANCWGGMALDEQRAIAYIATGSPKPNFAGAGHPGQNLYANCVVAIDAHTGAYRWHFQEIRHDIWDLDIPAPPVLVSMEWRGRKVDAVAQVTKLGNTLVLDRESGQPLFPFRLRRAPVSTLPGERTWPYQPDPALPEPFARQVFSRDDVTDRSPEARAHVLATLSNANMGWFEPFTENKPTALYGFHGGAEWTGAAFDPQHGKLYVSANNVPWIVTVFRPDPPVHDPAHPTKGKAVYDAHCVQCHGPERFGVGMAPPLHGLASRLDDDAVRELLRAGRNAMPAAEALPEEDVGPLLDYLFLRDVPAEAFDSANRAPLRYTHNGYPKLIDHEGYPGCKPPWGTLNCIDLASGKIDWQVPLGHYPDLALWGEDDTGAENFGGPAVTAGGLVFCAGTPDNLIRAFDAATGETLWEHELPFGGYAPPAVYEVDGKQYVVIAATGGGKLGTETGDAWVAFALP